MVAVLIVAVSAALVTVSSTARGEAAGSRFTRFIKPNSTGAGSVATWTSITNVDLDGDGADELLCHRSRFN